MVPFRPDRKTEISERHRLPIGDDDGLARCRTVLGVGFGEVLDGENVCIGDVSDVGEVVEVETGPDNEGSREVGDNTLDGWDQIRVSRAH